MKLLTMKLVNSDDGDLHILRKKEIFNIVFIGYRIMYSRSAGFQSIYVYTQVHQKYSRRTDMPKYLAFRPTLKKYFLQLLQKNTSLRTKC